MCLGILTGMLCCMLTVAHFKVSVFLLSGISFFTAATFPLSGLLCFAACLILFSSPRFSAVIVESAGFSPDIVFAQY